MDVSVIIVDWHRPDLTRRALDSVLAQRSGSTVEIVLVVNDADAETVAAYRDEYPSVVVAPQSENRGFAGGVAAGVDASRGDVLAFVNNDAVADNGFIDRGLAALASGGAGVAAVAATAVLEGLFEPVPVGERRSDDDLVGSEGTRWRRAATGRTLVNGTGVLLDRSGNGRDRDWLRPLEMGGDKTPLFGFSGGAAFVRRSALAEVGGFDPSLFMYYEDLDVSWRLRLAGYGIGFAPDAVVVHRHAASSGSDSPLVRYQSMRNRLAVVARNGSVRLVARVAWRTLVRMLLDQLRPGARQLTPAQWRRLIVELPRVLRHATRYRRRDAVTAAQRRRVERLLTP